jgi:hypothetical protein
LLLLDALVVLLFHVIELLVVILQRGFRVGAGEKLLDVCGLLLLLGFWWRGGCGSYSYGSRFRCGCEWAVVVVVLGDGEVRTGGCLYWRWRWYCLLLLLYLLGGLLLLLNLRSRVGFRKPHVPREEVGKSLIFLHTELATKSFLLLNHLSLRGEREATL